MSHELKLAIRTVLIGGLLAAIAASAYSSASLIYVVESIGHLGGGYSYPTAMNPTGQVVGYSRTRDSVHAFLYDGRIHDLTPGSSFSQAIAINNLGQIVGSAAFGDAQHAILYSRGAVYDLGTLGGGYSVATGINSSGQIIGQSTLADSRLTHAFLFTDGRMLDITPGAEVGVPTRINDLGQVVGFFANASTEQTFHIFLYSDGVFQDLGSQGGYFNFPSALNASGQIAGYGDNGPDRSYGVRSFLYTGGRLQDVGTLGGLYTWASDMNNAVQIVGQSSTNEREFPGFFYSNGRMQQVPTLGGTWSYLADINEAGQAVGAAATAEGRAHGILYSDGRLYDVNALLTAPPGWTIDDTFITNDAGYIAGLADFYQSAILLKPATSTNAPPVVGALSLEPSLVPVAQPVSATASFRDLNTTDSHTGMLDWNDLSTSTASIAESGGAGTVSGAHSYVSAGIYTVTAKVTDNAGAVGQSNAQVVVYDPSGGFVSGAGWIVSPPGAYAADPALTGKATFAFVSKYKPGATKPSGTTQFQFHAAKFNFFSDTYDWLVVGGARAQFKGYGKVNGTGSYGFLLTAVDGQVTGGGAVDKFRIKIWNTDDGAIVYDNELGASADAEPSTTVNGGEVVIHK